MDGDGGGELVEGRPVDGDLLVLGGGEHIGGNGAGRAGEDGADAGEGGDGDGVLVGLDGNEDGILGGVGQNIAQEVGCERGGDIRALGGG